MPRSIIERAARRFIAVEGEAVTLTNYTQTGTDGYGDAVYSEDTATTTAVITHPNQPTWARTAAGQDAEAMARIYVADDAPVVDSDDDTPRATHITQDATGDTYRVQVTMTDDNGLIMAEAVRVDD